MSPVSNRNPLAVELLDVSAVYKLVALYQHPPNPAAFDQHFTEIHAPFLRSIPGLVRLIVTRGMLMPWGRAVSPYYLLVELHFKNRASFDRAMNSQQYQAAQDDMNDFAKGIVWTVTLWDS